MDDNRYLFVKNMKIRLLKFKRFKESDALI